MFILHVPIRYISHKYFHDIIHPISNYKKPVVVSTFRIFVVTRGYEMGFRKRNISYYLLIITNRCTNNKIFNIIDFVGYC